MDKLYTAVALPLLLLIGQVLVALGQRKLNMRMDEGEAKSNQAKADTDANRAAEAESRYHTELASALVYDAIIGVMCEVVDTDGIVHRIEHADGPAKAKAAQAAEAE